MPYTRNDVTYYSSEEGEQLKDKTVQCNMEGCDGKPCHGMHNKPHVYNDFECFTSCGHEGKTGMCVEVKS